MKALKIIGIVFGSIVGLAVVVVGVVWFLMSRPSGIAANVTDVVSSPSAAASLDSKWADFRDTVNAAPAGTEVTVTLTQEEVTSKINQELKSVELPAGLSMGDVSVNLVDGKLILSTDLNYSVFSGKAGMEAVIENVDGKPSIVVTNIDMGSLPIPQALKDQLKNLIPEGGVINLADLPFDVSSIKIVDGKMVVNGVTN